MDYFSVVSKSGAGSRFEGAILGLMVGAVTWVWIAVVDALFSTPFRTFTFFGGIGPYSVVHEGLSALFGTILVAGVRTATRVPSAVLAVVFGSVLFSAAVAMITVLLANLGLGELAWMRIVGAHLLGIGLTFAVLMRRYPIGALLEHAQEDD
jgi:hypothetical protein